jgi:eukaryotic-like serine/threonine-protein kinase
MTPGDDEDRTVYQPSSQPAEPTLVPQAPGAPPPSAQQVKVGDVLNHMFEVRRFIARGGMGEVFEGVNISSDDERVAIKVMLPALSADPNVQAMFRREASTLRRLRHPALVHYLILAQEPVLQLLYIVTEYIEGPSLADMIGRERLDAAQLRRLGARLADGLRVAHELGAVHRDISPDNILLEDGRLEQAKIIDFGIAKDTGGKKGTIVGDGFAGKLNYVAPEQLGAYDRQVGPWTDVYSLGLVLLAAAEGRSIDMGATLFEAVEKRREVPDLSNAPAELQPALQGMLQPDPAARMRSMAEVIDALGGAPPGGGTAFAPPPSPAEPARTVIAPLPATETYAPEPAPASRKGLLIGGGAAALAVIGGVLFLTLGTPADPVASPDGSSGATQPEPTPTANDPRAVVNQALPRIACTWMKVDGLDQNGASVSLRMKGVAQAPAQAQTAITQALQRAGLTVSAINFDQVAPVPASVCSVLDAFQSIRKPTATALSTPQREFEIETNAEGQKLAAVVATIDVAGSGGLALFELNQQGVVSAVKDEGSPVTSRRALSSYLDRAVQAGVVTKEGPTRYRAQLDSDTLGWSGFLMLTGREPFDVALISTPPAQRDAAWRQRFAQAAAAGGWQAEMVWYEVTDRRPNAAP